MDGDASVNAGDFSGAAPARRYQPRLQTIASIVNTMMGTTILALPYGMSQAGVALGLVITALVGAVSCATCLIVVERGAAAGREDFAGAVRAHLGARAARGAWAFAVAIIVGAALVYHILMADTLFALVNTLAPGATARGWSRAFAALAPWAIYPVCNLRDLSLLVRFNSLGFLFMGATMAFIVFHGARALAGGAGVAALRLRATAGAGAPHYSPAGEFYVTTVATPSFAALGGMVSRARARAAERRARACAASAC
jgi:hypothetical protein